jgi:methyl-accepting chemotaxis protein
MVELIRAISKQTRVLSLNAAIQAARDSSTGRTFVVVAGEMRQLAQQSETTSKEVNELVALISGTVRERLAAMVSKDRLDKDSRWLEVLSNSMGTMVHNFEVAVSDLECLSDYAHSAMQKINDTVLNVQQLAQYQDKSRQQVELVRSGLQDLGTASEKLSRQLDGTFANGEGAPDALFSGIFPALESRYTMGSQNETHDKVLRGGTGDSRGLPAIELF